MLLLVAGQEGKRESYLPYTLTRTQTHTHNTHTHKTLVLGKLGMDECMHWIGYDRMGYDSLG